MLLLAMVKTFVFIFMQFENDICKAHAMSCFRLISDLLFNVPHMRVSMITALLVLFVMIITMFINIINNDVIMRMMLAGKGKRREN